ncbi:MAG: MerR family transcriptional regulator [Clostridiaceae bacterium]|nr:MerR family transcriptional regulator [Clostridiaceae bacterium]
MNKKQYLVGEIAAATGLTVRTLQHYDNIGLLPVSGRTTSGRRYYSQADLVQLEQIIFYKSIAIGIMITLLTFLSGQIILSSNGMNMVSLSSFELIQLLVGCAVIPIFYCLLTVCLTFLFQSSAGSISFTLGTMLLPAFITWFSTPVQQVLLPIMPRSALHSLAGIAERGTTEELTILSSISTLAIWILIAYFIGVWKFKRRDL